jgi:Flp pilus assembly protein TadG
MRALLFAFGSNTRANVAVITAVSATPLISAIGCVVDYTTAAMIRTKLQAAADAATLAAVSANSPLITTAKGMTGNGNVSNGSTTTTNFYNADLTGTTGYTTSTPTATVTKSGKTITATLSFSAQVPTFFMGVIGYSNIAISGTSTSSYTLPTYIDFYLTIDVSGSMSFPSTASEQARLQAVNPDNMTGSNGYPGGCTFACHFTAQGPCSQGGNPGQGPYPAVGTATNPSPGGYCQGFIISRLGTTPVSFASGNNSNNGTRVNWTNTQVSSCPTPGTTSCIQLRADAVGYAVNQLLSTANNSEQATNQFRVGLYPFIVNLYSYFPLTTTLNGSASTAGTINYAAAQLATLLDTGTNASLGSGGTHFENALTSMNNIISTVGTGTSTSNTLPYVFLITDGSQDCQTQYAASLAVSAITEAPVSTMKLIGRPSMRPSTRKCPRGSRGTTMERDPGAASRAGAVAASAASAAGADPGWASLRVRYLGTRTPKASAKTAKTTTERMKNRPIASQSCSRERLANSLRHSAHFASRW